jgi:hypothetical protein
MKECSQLHASADLTLMTEFVTLFEQEALWPIEYSFTLRSKTPYFSPAENRHQFLTYS